MPWLVCPTCSKWSLLHLWTDATVRFSSVCPACGAVHDVSELPAHLINRDEIADELRHEPDKPRHPSCGHGVPGLIADDRHGRRRSDDDLGLTVRMPYGR